MWWLFGEGIFLAIGMFLRGIYIHQGLFRLVMGVVSQWIFTLLGFVGRYYPYYWLGAIFLPGPR